MKAKPTPGPWRYQAKSKHIADHGHHIMSGEDDRVAHVWPMNLTPGAREANARLIAASPDMILDLARIADLAGNRYADAEEVLREIKQIAVLAIHKATGGEHE